MFSCWCQHAWTCSKLRVPVWGFEDGQPLQAPAHSSKTDTNINVVFNFLLLQEFRERETVFYWWPSEVLVDSQTIYFPQQPAVYVWCKLCWLFFAGSNITGVSIIQLLRGEQISAFEMFWNYSFETCSCCLQQSVDCIWWCLITWWKLASRYMNRMVDALL